MRLWMRDRLTQGGMNAAPTGNVGGAFMRPAGIRRTRIHAPLDAGSTDSGRHECRPYGML